MLIANLAVALTAVTNQFASKMQGAGKMVDEFVGKAQSASASITSAFKAIAIPVGIAAGIGVMVKATADAVEQNLNLADKMQTTYKEMMALRIGAENAGGSIEGMTKAMESLQERLGKGDKGALDALKQIGLSADQLLGKGAFQQITLIAGAFEKIGSAETKAAVGSELFGKASRELNTFLTEGSAALAKNLDYVDRVGLAMSDTSAQKFKTMGDSIDELWQSLKGMWQQLLLVVATPLTALINGISEMAQGAVLMAKGFQEVAHWVAKATLNMANFLTLGMSGGLAETIGNMRGLEASGDQISEKSVAQKNAARLDQIAKLKEETLAANVGINAQDVERHNAQDAAYGAKMADAQTRDRNGGFLTRDLPKLFTEAFATALPKFTEWFRDSANAVLDKKSEQDALKRVGEAMNPMSELGLSGFYDQMKAASPMLDAESGGTRGTFASDNAGRSLQTVTIQKQQLETLKSIDDHLSTIEEEGVVANAG